MKNFTILLISVMILPGCGASGSQSGSRSETSAETAVTRDVLIAFAVPVTIAKVSASDAKLYTIKLETTQPVSELIAEFASLEPVAIVEEDAALTPFSGTPLPGVPQRALLVQFKEPTNVQSLGTIQSPNGPQPIYRIAFKSTLAMAALLAQLEALSFVAKAEGNAALEI